MIAKIWLSLALCILAVAANFQIQDDKEFQTNILDTSKVSLVFLKNTDTTSIDLDSTIGFIQPIYDVLSPYDIQVTSIDCTSKQLKKSCQGLRAPAVLVYFDQPTMNPYTKKNYRQPIQYTGDGSVNSIQRFIAKSYPNIIAKVTSVGDMNSITNTITLSETPVAFLISDKDTIPVFFKSIAHQFTDKIKFLFVPAKTGTEVLTYWQITTTPLLSVLSSSEAMSLTPFTGSLSNRADVVSWLNEFVKIKSDEESASASTSSSSSSSSSTSSQQPVKWKEENNMLRLDELSTTSAFLIGVFPESQIVEGDLNFDIWREKVAPLCEGNVKAVLVKCPNMTGKCTHGSHFCHTDISAPFIYVKEYLGKSAESSSFYYAQNEKKFPEYELARKQVFESLPKTNIKYLDSENAFQRFIGENNNAKRLPIIALSKKSGVTPVLHNIALTLSEMKSDSSSKVMDDDNSIAQLGFLSNPSPELLQSIGNPILPAIITLFLQPGEGYTANPGSQAMVSIFIF